MFQLIMKILADTHIFFGSDQHSVSPQRSEPDLVHNGPDLAILGEHYVCVPSYANDIAKKPKHSIAYPDCSVTWSGSNFSL
jgi:hypothetical protein